jgi:hypothetical protein
MGFPEGLDVKAPGDSDFPFGAFSFISADKQSDHQGNNPLQKEEE